MEKDPSSAMNVTGHLHDLLIWYNIRGGTVGKDPSSAMNVTRHSNNLLLFFGIRGNTVGNPFPMQ